MKRSELVRGAALATMMIAVGSCASPTNEPGYSVVGIYSATETVDITTLDNHPLMTIVQMATVRVMHGQLNDLVLDDGQCLIPADAMGADMISLHHGTVCYRATTGPNARPGDQAILNIDRGGGTGDRALHITATGTFNFFTTSDAGMAMGMGAPNTGMFTLHIEGMKL